VLKEIHRPKREEVTGELRKIHTDYCHHLYTYTVTLGILNQIAWLRRDVKYPYRDIINASHILVVEPKGENNIKMELTEAGCQGVDGIQLAECTVHW
jgi:hypothetical protein